MAGWYSSLAWMSFLHITMPCLCDLYRWFITYRSANNLLSLSLIIRSVTSYNESLIASETFSSFTTFGIVCRYLFSQKYVTVPGHRTSKSICKSACLVTRWWCTRQELRTIPVRIIVAYFFDGVTFFFQGVDSLRPLLEEAVMYIPKTKWRDTSIALKATAGLRLLSNVTAALILEKVRM